MVALVSNAEVTNDTEMETEASEIVSEKDDKDMAEAQSSQETVTVSEDDSPIALSQEPMALPGDGMPSEEELRNLRGLLRYYTDGIVFIKQFESAVPLLVNLLASSVKGEVVEAMRFFVMAYRYEMECAQVNVIFL
jgi:condensin complex subunit 1